MKTDNLFHIIHDAYVILKTKKGVYTQHNLYYRENRLFADWGRGFIRLGGGDATSCPDVTWEGMDTPPTLVMDKGKVGEPLIRSLKIEE